MTNELLNFEDFCTLYGWNEDSWSAREAYNTYLQTNRVP